MNYFFLYVFHPDCGSNQIFSTGSKTELKTGYLDKKNPDSFGFIQMNQKRIKALISSNLLQSLICWILSKLNGLKRISLIEWIWDIVTKEKLAVNSLLPKFITAFHNVNPWLLYTVIAYARWIGIYRHEHNVSELSFQIHRMDAIGTILVSSKLVIVGPS